MSIIDRRTFVQCVGMTTAATAVVGAFNCQRSKTAPRPAFKYAMCNESMRELSWREQCRIVAQAGYQGIEIAAFTLVNESVLELDVRKRAEMTNVMQDQCLQCAGLHWLLMPPPHGLHFTTPDDRVRTKTIDYVRNLVDFCADLGGDVMVFGSPKQRSSQGIPVIQARQNFIDGLAALADHARQRNVKILIEPLDHSQTDVVNTLAEAVEIVKKLDHPAVQTMFDFHNTVDETEPFAALVQKNSQYIHHVHVQEMDGKHLGTGGGMMQYVPTFQLLKNLKYDQWISLEVFDFTPGGETIARESMRVLLEIEKKLR